MAPRRFLVVKLATLGDVLLTTPALRALRNAYPNARIDLLATAPSAVLLDGNDAVDEVLTFDKFAFDRPTQAWRALPVALSLGRDLRARRYDAAILLHHLTTAWG